VKVCSKRIRNFLLELQQYGTLARLGVGDESYALTKEENMGFLDGVLGGVVGAEALSLVKGYFEKHGGIEGVVAELEKTSLGQHAKSWVGNGPNLPVTADQIQQALGSQTVKDLGAKFGIPVDKVTEMLAKYLPTAVDKATPDGKLPS
jgi:uncharacterized protein YidB (DUF937 family)